MHVALEKDPKQMWKLRFIRKANCHGNWMGFHTQQLDML
jgi:hypothetical protein